MMMCACRKVHVHVFEVVFEGIKSICYLKYISLYLTPSLDYILYVHVTITIIKSLTVLLFLFIGSSCVHCVALSVQSTST